MKTNTLFLRTLVLPTFVLAGSAMLFAAENAFIDYTGNAAGFPANVVHQSPGLGLVVDASNSGDWRLTFNGNPYDVLNGVIIPQAYPTFGSDHIGISGNPGRGFIEVPGRFTEVGPSPGFANGWLSLTDISGAGGTEANFDMGFVYFPQSEGWLSGTVSINGVIQTGNTTGVTVLRDFDDPGRFTLTIDGVNSLSSGMLFVVGGDNAASGNAVSTEARADGLGWDIISYDQNATFTDTDFDLDGDGGQDGTFHFAYVPYTAQNLIGGRIDDDASILAGTGGFTSSLVPLAPAGRYLLQIPDGLGGFYDDADGLIIATPSKGASLSGAGQIAVDPDDNFLEVLYNPGLQGWEVRSFDLNAANAQVTEFVFAFSRYDAPITVPEPSTALALLAGGGMLFARRRRVST